MHKSKMAVLAAASLLLAACSTPMHVATWNAQAVSADSSSAYSFSYDAEATISTANTAAPPEKEAFTEFFSAYGAAPLQFEDSLPQNTENALLLQYGSVNRDKAQTAYSGALNYDADGITLLNAGFQINGSLAEEDAVSYFTGALALLFPEKDQKAWHSFLEESFADAGGREREYRYIARSGDSEVSLLLRPDSTAAPAAEMTISI